MPRKRKIKKDLPSVPDASAQTGARRDVTNRRRLIYVIGAQIVAFLVAFAIVVSRRPDAVLNAQFYAEEGSIFYPAAYRFGLHTLLMPYGAYLQTLVRLVALFVQLFPLSWAPLIMNLAAITVQILPVNVFLSSRFSQIPFRMRLLAGLLYLAVPNSHEIDANITNSQVHLVLLACLLLLARPASSRGWRVFDAGVLVLTSLSSLITFALVPLAAALWWKRRHIEDRRNFALLAPGTVFQVLSALLTWQSRQVAPNGPTLVRLINILGRQVFLASLLGLGSLSSSIGDAVTIVEVVATVLGLTVLLYALRYAPMELKLFILFAFTSFAMALARPLAGPPDRPQWSWLCVPGCGNRYYFLPMLSFLAALLWMAVGASHRKLRYFGATLLLLLPIGIYQDWRYTAFKDLHFKEYAAQFEQAPPGTEITIPINPDWKMKLTKR